MYKKIQERIVKDNTRHPVRGALESILFILSPFSLVSMVENHQEVENHIALLENRIPVQFTKEQKKEDYTIFGTIESLKLVGYGAAIVYYIL